MIVVDIIVAAITFVAATALLTAYFAPYISPVKSWIIAFAGLAAPILYVVNGFLILYWIIRWKRFAFIPIVVFLLGLGNLSLFFRPTVSKEFDEERAKPPLVVMSYNVMGFGYEVDKGRKVSDNLRDIVGLVHETRADIVCFQEFRASTITAKETIDSLMGLKHNVVNYRQKNRDYGGWGVAIYSRHPIINSGVVEYPNSVNSSIWADVVVEADTIRVFNNHLQTTSVNTTEQEYISSHEYLGDTNREEKVRGIAAKLRNNFKIRAEQADSLAPLIQKSPYESVVCGDFNDTPLSYVYTKILGKRLIDPFRKKGHGLISNTYKGLFNMFRIDYVLHSKKFMTVEYHSPSVQFSDHKPVIVGIDPRQH